MKIHKVDDLILGHDIQFVDIELDPNETVIAETNSTAIHKEFDNDTLCLDSDCLVTFSGDLDIDI